MRLASRLSAVPPCSRGGCREVGSWWLSPAVIGRRRPSLASLNLRPLAPAGRHVCGSPPPRHVSAVHLPGVEAVAVWLNRGGVTCGDLSPSSEPCVVELAPVGSRWAACGSPPPRHASAVHLPGVEAVAVWLNRGAVTCGGPPLSSEPCVFKLVSVSYLATVRYLATRPCPRRMPASGC